ncbi:MAG TPA: metallophosphoesterase [Xanthobacteraceae bacterium]|nr:metallophosphoesterase [Xanthobacteraceae bacterium]
MLQVPQDMVSATARAPKRRITRRKFLLASTGLVALTGGGATAYSYFEAQRLVVTRYSVVTPRWPNGKGLSITVIADLHAGGPNMLQQEIQRIVETANGLKSDIVVLLGDYFATHRFVTEKVPHAVWAAELAKLQAPLGKWAILGNHDWWFDIDGVRKALADVHIPVLENKAVPLGEESNRFWLAGVGDQLAYPLGNGKFRGVDDLKGTLDQVRTEDPVILLVHEPDIFPQVPDNVALTIAGHTHGGQIRLPFIWPMLVPSAYGARYAYGHIVEQHRHMVVSGGLGVSYVPLRLGVPPEIVRIDIKGPALGETNAPSP